MIPVRLQVIEEATDLGRLHGRASVSRDSAFFHTSRAKQSLDAALLAHPLAPDSAVLDRLIHLSAVCMRLAMAWNGEETG